MARYRRVGTVARWKPVHLGHAAVLEALCDGADHVLVGVGSANRHDLKNPFTFEETVAMIRAALPGRENFELLAVPDLNDGPRWRLMVRDLFGELDLFFTDNPYVAHLMEGLYEVARPVSLVPAERRVAVDGTRVRFEMAKGDAWRGWVPAAVADYIAANGLDARFRREFGLEALAASVA